MSSILTNSSAMVALDTLRSINTDLNTVQNEISTGKKISSSKDNAAIWSISTVMNSDVESFSQVTDSLNLGSANIGVARSASEQVTDLLTQAKSTIVAANDASISDSDRAKYQTDLQELTASIASIVDAASPNGQNMLKAGDDVAVLSSLNRQADGTVTTGNIAIQRQDLSTTAGVTAGAVGTGDATGATLSDTALEDNGTTETITITDGVAASENTYTTTIGGQNVTYVAAEGLDQDAIATGFAAAIQTVIDDNSIDASASATDGVITLTNTAATTDGSGDITIGAVAVAGAEKAAGGLSELSGMDISTSGGASTALNQIDTLLQTAIDATAYFGSKENRIENQVEFVTTLTDSLQTGIGAMTDANLEEASARLQSLQVQQQLGTQALTIANQAPQQILSLFR